jgi:transposase
MSKRKYRAVSIKQIDFEQLVTWASVHGKVVVAVDVAKEDFFAALADKAAAVERIVKWKHPLESEAFLSLVSALAKAAEVDVAMEPSGVYGDALRAALSDRGVSVFRVSPKRTHDAAEVYDGVPSLHDAKSASIIAKLHIDGASESWAIESDRERQLTAALRILEVHEKEVGRNRNRLEGFMSRHWPELTRILDLNSATLLELLMEYGGPAAVARKPEEGRGLMKRVGGHFLDPEKIDAVLATASTTIGMNMIDEEERMVKTVAGECRRQQKAAKEARNRLEKLSMVEGSTRNMAPVVGKTTAAVIVAAAGDPQRYDSASAFEKSLGLNLKEKSSGKKKGGLHITKRGSGAARMHVFLAALRLINSDHVVRAWYAKKVRRDGGKQKSKAIVAIMRKLVRALWHVARGAEFDSSKLFDTARLDIHPTLADLQTEAPG